MAAKKKKARKVARKAKPMQVVSLKSALHMVKQAERRIRARRMKRNPDYECGESNPLRHFPKLKGRGRPAKTRKWTLAMRLANGSVREKTFKSTREVAYARAQRRIASGTYDGQKVAEVVLDDGR